MKGHVLTANLMRCLEFAEVNGLQKEVFDFAKFVHTDASNAIKNVLQFTSIE